MQVEVPELHIEGNPPVTEYQVELPTATLDDIRADFRRLRETLKAKHSVEPTRMDYSSLRTASPLIREAAWSVRVAVRGEEVIGVCVATGDESPLGLAVDLGTTKIALYLLRLDTGETIDVAGIANPQGPYGEDVMSRLQTIMEDEDALDLLSSGVVKAINEEASRMCRRNRVSSQRILEAVVVGNTAMHHIALKLPTRQLALSPFVPATDRAVEVKARELGLSISRGAYVYFPPPIAGFVGSDHVAMLLASRLYAQDGNALGIDIGTNTEIALKTPKGITACSTASGPAFEGARIKCGMKASAGAIEHVTIHESDLQVEMATIADEPPRGVCGSGVLDSISEMLRVGIINGKGRMQSGKQGVRSNAAGRPEFVLAHADGDRCRDDIVITQRDVAEIQLAKGAVRTGVNMLLARAGLNDEDIDVVVLAGAFGSYIDPASAVGLGMLPRLPLDRFQQIGNAAGAGAKAMLASLEERRTAEQLAAEVQYMELAAEADFHRQFARGMKFDDGHR